ncbi:hypothetical protein GP2143_04605 [marine gamma proteobacterium HTCC2143]|jgi:hypothetical protein|uniref:Uncharacterized protein n=1 Tax=marine gamma proteobacterium HTCC2143 TaxID=247633 RepID=A0YAX1_9GAMM|nr:hypothetical protein GP2143_04605 [marine gamma proteobacterium HTCC2143]
MVKLLLAFNFVKIASCIANGIEQGPMYRYRPVLPGQQGSLPPLTIDSPMNMIEAFNRLIFAGWSRLLPANIK